jgi:hypothetical protein
MVDDRSEPEGLCPAARPAQRQEVAAAQALLARGGVTGPSAPGAMRGCESRPISLKFVTREGIPRFSDLTKGKYAADKTTK